MARSLHGTLAAAAALIVLSALFMMTGVAWADNVATPKADSSSSDSNMKTQVSGPGFWDFRLSQFTVVQSGGNSFAAAFSWNPWFRLSDSFGLRGELGIGGAKKSSGSDSSVLMIPELAVLGTYSLSSSVWLEAGPGYQIWVGAGNAKAFTATGGAVYQFASPFLKFIDGIAVNYTAALLTNNFTNEMRAGVVF